MQVRLIVPDVNGPLNYQKEIAGISGGFTATQATGGWTDADGNLIIEPVTVFDIDCTPEDTQLQRFYDLAKTICRDLHQQCVYLRIDSEVHYVSNI